MASDDIWPPREPWVGAWLLTIAGLVVAMILVGGATRLTDSGLSITEWDLGKGLTPPLTTERWVEEFDLYQRTLEYQTQNNGMSLAEFQHIYWWEWAHRFLGKLIGLAFALPALLFLFAGRLRGRFRVTALLFVMGGLQGAVGWWMVTSGLFDRLDVSPVRLAIHLGMALLILALTLWTAMGAFAWPGRPSSLGMPRAMALSVAALIFVQAMFGALLAGADGGAAYADWPRIGGEWLPSSAFGLEPIWRNFSEDHATQHLLHRNLGYVVALTALVVALGALFRGSGAARWCAILLGLAAVTQAGLGIVTVLGGSTLTPSLLHQGAAVLLWTTSIATARAVVVT
ncbi:MAG: COX15/CtaA family protein [Hyphomonadaceae bacterium]|nr:COX15/CtaA family protein [Hyphomonadaceae bacterium]